MAIITGSSLTKREKNEPEKGSVGALIACFNRRQIPFVYKEYLQEKRLVIVVLMCDLHGSLAMLESELPVGVRVEVHGVEHRSQLSVELINLEKLRDSNECN